MSEEQNDIPQIVGLSKKQFFGFLIAALITGASMFAFGYIMAFINKKETTNSSTTKKINYSKYTKKYLEKTNMINIQDTNNNMQTKNDQQITKNYIILGKFKEEEQAKNLIEIIKKIGKVANLKISSGQYLVFLGPYTSQSIAENELESITLLSGNINGSIVGTLP